MQDGRQDKTLATWLNKVDRQVNIAEAWLSDVSNEHDDHKEELLEALDERVSAAQP
jgi:hypothetical protein